MPETSQLSKHFNRSEFACKCGNCSFDTVDVQLIPLLEAVRVHFDSPVTINSACRCHAHNTAVGGKPNSQHLYGRAADIVVKGHTPKEVHDLLESLMKGWGGLGLYESFVHVDTRTGGQARW